MLFSHCSQIRSPSRLLKDDGKFILPHKRFDRDAQPFHGASDRGGGNVEESSDRLQRPAFRLRSRAAASPSAPSAVKFPTVSAPERDRPAILGVLRGWGGIVLPLPGTGGLGWLSDMDSNHDYGLQRPVCCHYTIGHPFRKPSPHRPGCNEKAAGRPGFSAPPRRACPPTPSGGTGRPLARLPAPRAASCTAGRAAACCAPARGGMPQP